MRRWGKPAWPIGTNPHLLDNGNIVDASKDDPSGFGGFREVDWDGKTVWEYTEKRQGYTPHHDWVRIFNKKLNAPTTIYIANKAITHEQAIAAGADPRKGPYREGQMDAVVEVDMAGNVIWEWWFFDHVVQDIDAGKSNYVGAGKTLADHPGRININMPGRPLKRDWLHCNSMDYNARSGHIVINSVQGELYVVDHDGTFVAGDAKAGIAAAAGPDGDFLYRFATRRDTGRANLRAFSKTGTAPRPVISKWEARTMHTGLRRVCPVNAHGFFSHIGSSAQRLPNGNTFICSDTEGHFFEVTADGKLVWEYVNPVTRDGAVKVLGDVLPMTNSAFRAYRFAPDHPAFKGRELTPGGTITERAEKRIDAQPRRRPPGERPPRQGDRGPNGPRKEPAD